MKLVADLISDNYEKLNKDIIHLVSLKNYSTGNIKTYDIDELVKLKKEFKLSIGVNINTIIHEDESLKYIELLDKLIELEIDYIFYTDLLIRECLINQSKIKLVYVSTTYATNCYDIKEYLIDNQYVAISSDLSIDEIKYINDNVNSGLALNVFGKLPIFVSRRKLVSMYSEYSNLNVNAKNNSSLNIIEELRTEKYPIYESNDGVTIYSNDFYMLDFELDKLDNIDLLIVKSNYLDANIYENIVKQYFEYTMKKHDFKELKEFLTQNNIKTNKGITCKKTVLLKNNGDKNE